MTLDGRLEADARVKLALAVLIEPFQGNVMSTCCKSRGLNVKHIDNPGAAVVHFQRDEDICLS